MHQDFCVICVSFTYLVVLVYTDELCNANKNIYKIKIPYLT